MEKTLSGLDILRFLAAVGCVLLHSFMEYDRFADAYVVAALVRWAVPMFMLINGYFMRSDFKKLFKTLCILMLQYTVWTVFYAIILGINIWNPYDFLSGLRSGIIMPFWYYPTIMITFAFVWVINKLFKSPWVAVGIGCVLYVFALIGNTWMNVEAFASINNGIILDLHRRIVGQLTTRDGIFWATFYVSLGHALREINDKDKAKLAIKNIPAYVIAVVGVWIIFIVEISLNVFYHTGAFDVFIVQIPFSVMLFILGLNMKMSAKAGVFLRKMSNNVFLIHYLFLTVFMRYLGMGIRLFIATLVCSLAVSIVLAFLSQKNKYLGYVLG